MAKLACAFGDACRTAGVPALATGFIEEPNLGLYRTSGFDVMPFTAVFDGRDMREYGYDPARTSTHFSERGNDVIALALARYIRARYAWPARPSDRQRVSRMTSVLP